MCVCKHGMYCDLWGSPVSHAGARFQVPMNTLRFGYFLSDTLHARSGTVENMRGSHRSMRCAYAQSSLHFKPVTTNPSIQNPEIMTEGDQGEDPGQYSDDHVVVKGKAGTIFAFQNGIWHRALPNYSPIPRTIVYFQYTPTMIHPLHRPTPYGGDLSIFTPEQRFLMHEQKAEPKDWVYGSARDKVRLDRFRRENDRDADYYQKALELEASAVNG